MINKIINKVKSQKIIPTSIMNIILIVVSVIAVNIIFSWTLFRADMTEENLYTLSEGTEQIVNQIKEPTHLRLFFSKSIGSIPLPYKNYGQRVTELLREYVNLNPGMLTLEVLDPKIDSDEELTAERSGLTSANIGHGERFYLGLIVAQAEKEVNIPFFDLRREESLEYDISQILLEVNTKKNTQKTIGIMSNLPVMGKFNSPNQNPNQKPQKWAFIEDLEKNYQIQTVDINTEEIDNNLSMLVLIHPKNLSKNTEYAIDQFIMKGGKLIVLVDPNARIDQQANMMNQYNQQPQKGSDLTTLFKHWKVQYDPSKILGDLDTATSVNIGPAGIVPYSLWHSLTKSSFNQEIIATKDLETMLMIEPGGFSLQKESPLKLTPLIETSRNAAYVSSMIMRYMGPEGINNAIKPNGQKYVIAGILNGKLTSAFTEKPGSSSKDKKSKSHFSNHINKTEKSASILVIADVDFISDDYSVRRFQILGQVYNRPMNDNMGFILNSVDYLNGSEELMMIRSRGRFTRPFLKFQELEKSAQNTYKTAENRLKEKLRNLEQKLSELKVDKSTNQVVLTKDQHEKIQQFVKEKANTKKELRKIRKFLREDIEFLINMLIILNLIIIPLGVIIFGIFLFMKRTQRMNTQI